MSVDSDSYRGKASLFARSPWLSRWFFTYVIATVTGSCIELTSLLSSELAPSLIGVMLVVIVGFMALLTMPLSLVIAGAFALGAGALRRARHSGTRSADSVGSKGHAWLLFVPVAMLLAIWGTQFFHRWAAATFQRPSMGASAIAPVILAFNAAVAAATWATYQLLKTHLNRISRRQVWIALAALTAVFLAIEVRQLWFMRVDARFALAAQVCIVATAGVVAFVFAPWLRWRPGVIAATIAAIVTTGLWMANLYGGRWSPTLYRLALTQTQTTRFATASIARFASRIGDADRDGFSRFFLATDCNDSDSSINPVAYDIPGNGIDEDCYRGDRAPATDMAPTPASAVETTLRARNLLVITADTVRADAVGFGGAELPTTPNLDRLAKKAAVFTRAYSHGPDTRRAFPSMFIGRYPGNIHWRTHAEKGIGYLHPLIDKNVFLWQILADANMKTGMAVPFDYARGYNIGIAEGKIRNASKYKQEINGDVLVDDAIKLLRSWYSDDETGPPTTRTGRAIPPGLTESDDGDESDPGAGEGRASPPTSGQQDRPRFGFWLHFYEAHAPYAKHRDQFGPSDRERYLSEVRFIDRQIGRLLGELETLGLADETAIIFTSDHGEEFGEHEGKHHGDLHIEDLHVPLLIYVPGQEARVIDVPVEHIDMPPTALAILGLPPAPTFEGNNLLPAVESAAAESSLPGVAFAEMLPDKKADHRLHTAITHDWQIIANFRLGTRVLYHLVDDPWGQRDRTSRHVDELVKMEDILRAHIAEDLGKFQWVRLPKGQRSLQAERDPARDRKPDESPDQD